MTDLEAAEEILKGPFITCATCKGNGCLNCAERGQFLRRDYQKACAIVGMRVSFYGWVYYDRDD